LGLWGPSGIVNVARGSFQRFAAYTGQLNPWAPAVLVPPLAWFVTVAAEKVHGGMKRTTALKIVALLREILNHAVEDRLIPSNPATRIGRFYRGRTEEEARPAIMPLTETELATLLSACKRWYPEWLDLIALAAWTGIRQGEVLGLHWADFDFAGHFVEVRRTVAHRGGNLLVGSPKSGKARRVDLPTPLAAALQHRKSLLEAEAAIQGRDLVP
jgi:integrase